MRSAICCVPAASDECFRCICTLADRLSVVPALCVTVPVPHDHDIVLMIDRERAQRSEPTAAILDSQIVKSRAGGGSRGFDGAKRLSVASATSRSTPTVAC